MTENFQNYLFLSRNEVKVTLYVVTEKKITDGRRRNKSLAHMNRKSPHPIDNFLYLLLPK